jgi:hypothetical protein
VPPGHGEPELRRPSRNEPFAALATPDWCAHCPPPVSWQMTARGSDMAVDMTASHLAQWITRHADLALTSRNGERQ